MKTNIERISSKKKLFYSYKEILDLYNELYDVELSSISEIPRSRLFEPFKDNTTFREVVENFYINYFEQDFEVLHRVDDNIFEIVDVFSLPITHSDEYSHISVYHYSPNENLYIKAFKDITINNKNDITTSTEYVHEIGHALTERTNVIDDEFLGEMVPILLELLFAYDIDTDDSFYQGNEYKHNIYNPYAIKDESLEYEEQYNYDTTRNQIKMRLDTVDILKEIYQEEQNLNNLNKYSIYYKSTVTAIEIFDSYLNGNVLVIGYLDDVLKGNMTVTEMVEEVSKYDKKVRRGYSK